MAGGARDGGAMSGGAMAGRAAVARCDGSAAGERRALKGGPAGGLPTYRRITRLIRQAPPTLGGLPSYPPYGWSIRQAPCPAGGSVTDARYTGPIDGTPFEPAPSMPAVRPRPATATATATDEPAAERPPR